MKHEIIYTEHYALIVSDGEIKEGDFNVPSDFDRTSDISITSKEDLEVVNDKFNGYKKVIAHRPLTDAPVLEGVPLLPKFSKEHDDEKVVERIYPTKGWLDCDETIDSIIHKQIAFRAGYNKAKETYKYTEEDLKNAFYNGWLYRGEKEYEYPKALNEFTQCLQQQKRPKYFETVCDCQECGANKTNLSLDMGCENKIATITNPQGQTEIVGEYIYE